MNKFWNERYSGDEYAYGTEPNTFFTYELAKLEVGKLLLPGEGEGRNAVHAAKQGWKVTAFDNSTMGKIKAEKLASLNNVEIEYKLNDFADFQYQPNCFDSIALIFVHIPNQLRASLHQKLFYSLKPGGTFILEGFSKEQINLNTGGPKNIDMLFSDKELRQDFAEAKDIKVTTQKIQLNEGKFHDGIASTIRLLASK